MEFFDYLTLKWLHILSATFLFGTGVGSAFYKLLADLGGDVHHIAQTNRHVVWADWLFTTPTFIIQPVSGIMLANVLGYSLSTPWLLASISLYVFIGLCWFPVVIMQIRMARMSAEAIQGQTGLTPGYQRLVRYWVALGTLAFVAMIAVYYLMVFKPGLWS